MADEASLSFEFGNSFEAQFNHKQTYESLGGTIESIFLKPEKPKSDVPVVIASGWSEGSLVLKQTAEQLYNAGRQVIILDHPRRGGEVIPHQDHTTEELRKALTIKEVVKQQNIHQVDILAHSEGAINAAIFASLEPGKVRNMVLVNPAGLIGKDTLPGMFGRFMAKNVQNIIGAIKDTSAAGAVGTGLIEGVKYMAQNPARAIKEVSEISQAQIDETLQDLHRLGVGIIVIHGADDPGFPMDRMQKIVKADTNDGFVDGFLSVKGGHDELYIHPEKYTKAAEKMLSALEKKQSSQIHIAS